MAEDSFRAGVFARAFADAIQRLRQSRSQRPRSFWSEDGDRDFWPGSPLFSDFPSLCACPESSLTNLIGSGLNLLCLQSHSKPECRWTWPGVPISSAWQKEPLGTRLHQKRHLWTLKPECCMADRSVVIWLSSFFFHGSAAYYYLVMSQEAVESQIHFSLLHIKRHFSWILVLRRDVFTTGFLSYEIKCEVIFVSWNFIEGSCTDNLRQILKHCVPSV